MSKKALRNLWSPPYKFIAQTHLKFVVLEHVYVWKEDITSITRKPIPGNFFSMHPICMFVEFLRTNKNNNEGIIKIY